LFATVHLTVALTASRFLVPLYVPGIAAAFRSLEDAPSPSGGEGWGRYGQVEAGQLSALTGAIPAGRLEGRSLTRLSAADRRNQTPVSTLPFSTSMSSSAVPLRPSRMRMLTSFISGRQTNRTRVPPRITWKRKTSFVTLH